MIQTLCSPLHKTIYIKLTRDNDHKPSAYTKSSFLVDPLRAQQQLREIGDVELELTFISQRDHYAK